MARRFSDIYKGAENAQALRNLNNYKENVAQKGSKRLRGGTRDRTRIRDRREVFIKPFGSNTTTTFKGYAVMIANPEQPTSAKFTENLVTPGRILLSVTPEDSANWDEAPDGYQPAKVTIFVPAGGTPTYVQSKLTKLYYLKYPGNSYNCGFGALTDAEEFTAGARAVKSAFKADFNQANFRANITPEKFAV
jgi:hypothetical protein